MKGRAVRLRGRLALWLGKPFLRARYDWADLAVKVDHQPSSYHKDWWQGQTMSILHVVEDMSRGRVFSPTAEETARLVRAVGRTDDGADPDPSSAARGER